MKWVNPYRSVSGYSSKDKEKSHYNVIFLFITTLSQDMFIVYFLFNYVCIFKFYYLYVCTFMAIGNTSLMLLSISKQKYSYYYLLN